MYSAGDSSGDGLSGLNQFAGMSGSIDWAAMAQQWIQMHDTSNFISMPDAPPPPNISNTFNEMNMVNINSTSTTTTTTSKKTFDEKGEADMDMDEDEESARCGDTSTPPVPQIQQGKNRDLIMQPQTPWYMQQQNVVVGPPVNENMTGIGNSAGPIIPSAPQWNATVWPPRINLPPPVPSTMLNVPLNSPMPNPTAHIPSLLKMNVPNPNTVRMISANTGEQTQLQSVVDAKKRKMLPAWIREGLEKMEREKQKQLEKAQNKKHEEPEGIDGTKYTEFVGTTDDATHTVNMKYKQSAERENDRSGFEDDGEIEDLDGVAIGEDTLVPPQNAASNDDEGSATSGVEYETDNENNTEHQYYKGKRSYEDRLADLMIVVRTTLTELLLEVTNQEIANLAQEAVHAHKAKASSAQVVGKSALSSITGKLGLAAYDDSTGDESSDSDDDASADNNPNNDSEEEIKACIRAKRRAFAKITDDIEESIAASAAREEQKLKYYTSLEKQREDDKLYKKEIAVGESERNDENSSGVKPSTSSATTSTVSKSYDRDFGETTETKLQNSNGKRQKDRNSRTKERTTRFSDNKDSKSAAAIAATYMSKIHNANTNLSGNPNGNTMLPIASTTNASSGGLTTSSAALPAESTQIAYNTASIKLVDDNSSGSVTALNKNLLNAAEAAYEKVTKSHRSSASRSGRERSHRSRHYDHRDRDRESYHYRERDSERESKRNREHRSTRDKDRGKERRHLKSQRDDHSSDEDDGGKHESQTSSSDTDTTSTSSTSSSSSSQQSSHYSRTSTSSKKKREHEYERRKRRDERSHRSSRSGRSRERSRHHSKRGGSYRHSSAEDDNDSRKRHSASRHGSSRKRSRSHSRSRSRSTYSSSSHWRRH